MSTRYVWKKYTVDTIEETHVRHTNGGNQWLEKTAWAVDYSDQYDGCACNGYSVSGSSFAAAGASVNKVGLIFDNTITGYSHFFINYEFEWDGVTYSAVCLTPAAGAPYSWKISAFKGTIDRIYHATISDNSEKDDVELNAITLRRGAGPQIGAAAGTSDSSYPGNGEQDNYWYIYQGSDNIDPTAVNYSKSKPKGGEKITVTLTPRSNTYGGTISYQYQYQVNSGAWTNIGTPTTAASVTVTVPKGAETFRVRAKASDDMGFTSGDYVTGATLGVQNLTADVGVNGKARAVGKMYFGVNGKAREIVAAYIGVNGKARRLF